MRFNGGRGVVGRNFTQSTIVRGRKVADLKVRAARRGFSQTAKGVQILHVERSATMAPLFSAPCVFSVSINIGMPANRGQ
jgi:hypothetical protein